MFWFFPSFVFSLSLKYTQCCFGCSTVTCSLSWRGLKSRGCVFLSCSAMLFTLWCQILFFFFFLLVNNFLFTHRIVQMDGRGHVCVPMPAAHYLHGPPTTTHPPSSLTYTHNNRAGVCFGPHSHTKHTYEYETAHLWQSYTDGLLPWGNISNKETFIHTGPLLLGDLMWYKNLHPHLLAAKSFALE